MPLFESVDPAMDVVGLSALFTRGIARNVGIPVVADKMSRAVGSGG